MKRAVFLDRDGVVNKSLNNNGIPMPPKCIEELQIIDGVKTSIKKLLDADYEVVVITNQPDISRGKLTLEVVNQIHSAIRDLTRIKYFYICPHDDIDLCSCRKPKPGLLLEASKELDIDLQRSYLVGDRWRDIQAGQSAGCVCYYIDYKYHEKKPDLPYIKVDSLHQASELILRRTP